MTEYFGDGFIVTENRPPKYPKKPKKLNNHKLLNPPAKPLDIMDAFAQEHGWEVQTASNCLRMYIKKKKNNSIVVSEIIYLQSTWMWTGLYARTTYKNGKTINVETKELPGGFERFKKILMV